MKFALLRCSTAHPLKESHASRETNVTGAYPPLGLAYLGAVLRGAGHQVRILDGDVLGLAPGPLLDLVEGDTQVVGFTSTTLAWPHTQAAARLARTRFPRATLVVGGPHVTAFPELTLRYSTFDLGVLGEGEETVLELARRLQAGASLADLPGCVTREEETIRTNLPGPFPEDLDRVPFPALDLLDLARYHSVVVREPFATMIASRGCPFRCAFCSQCYTGDRFRWPSAEYVLDEMTRNQREFGAREIVLFDETFGVNRKVALEVCEGIRRRGLSFRWNARTRLDVLDEELMAAMRSSGCYLLHLGIESGSQRILDKMNKGTNLDQIRRVVAGARRAGFRTHGYFMLGYPGETRREISATVRLSRSLGLDWASFTVTIPNPRTELHDQAVAEGLLDKDFWHKYIAGRTDGRIPFLASAECPEDYLVKTKRLAYFRFYTRPWTAARLAAGVVATGGATRLVQAAGLWLREVS